MQLTLIKREQLQALGAFLVSEFDSLIARIVGSWRIEHNDDDTHGHIHSDSISTGRLTFSDIVGVDINQAQLDNFNTDGLKTAAMLRISGTGSGGNNPSILITGILAPTDEAGAVIDGRVLVIENYTDRLYIALSHEDTTSLPNSRLTVPFNTPLDELAASTQALIPPRGLQILIYNAKTARWVVHNVSNDNIVSNYESAGSDNDLNVAGFVSCGTLLVSKTAFGQTISGFESSYIPANARKRITNVGEWTVDILHGSTSSVEPNRVYCPGQIRYRLHPRETVDLYRRSEGGWRLVVSGKADQWVDVTFAGGNFTANGGGSWTVGSSDQVTLCYHIDGNKMTVAFNLQDTVIAGGPTVLSFPIPKSCTSARDIRTALGQVVEGGVAVTNAFVRVAAGGTAIELYHDAVSGAWGNTTTTVAGEITFMILDSASIMEEPHTDVAHGDSEHSDQSHSDVEHSDVAHGDSHSDAGHSDVAHSDVAHADSSDHSDSHSDTEHSDTAHVDVAHEDSHTDQTTHVDHTDGPGHADTSPHGDIHNDVTHEDSPHSDTAHSDSHTDESTHNDTAHEDTAHTDSGHSDSHSDTVPHSDVAHQDVSHGDSAHADNIHEDIGFHIDTGHVDI